MIRAINRRWLRYSLRTLFVVMAIAPWLGWNFYQINERERMLHVGGVGYYSGFGSLKYMPLRWRLLGARPVYSIGSNHFTEDDLIRYRAAFPEADVSAEVPPLSPPIPRDPSTEFYRSDWLSGRAILVSKDN